MKISEQKLNNLILAAQAVCQSRNGSNPEATKIAHEKACDDLEKALKAAYGGRGFSASRK